MRIRKNGSAALAVAVFWIGALALAAPGKAQVWVERGPGPMLNGVEEGMPENPVAGAINAVAAFPGTPNLLFAGTVNGGVWMTSNATDDSPSWIPLTDDALPALSIKSLAMSPVDDNTLFAGTGSTSSFVGLGGPGIGVARSTDL